MNGFETSVAEQSERRPVLFGLLTATMAGAGISVVVSSAGCGPGFDFEAPVVFTGTISLSQQRVLAIDTSVILDLRGSRRGDNEVTWSFEGTVSATSAEAAENLAMTTTVEVRDDDLDQLTLTLPPPQDGLLDGVWIVSAPADLDLSVVGRGRGQQIADFEGDITVEAAGGVAILGAQRNVSVRSNNGDILVDTILAPSTTTELSTAGSIQLAIPLDFSARIDAQAGQDRLIDIRHPNLPPWPGNGAPYSVSVGGALSRAGLVSSTGDVFITLPL